MAYDTITVTDKQIYDLSDGEVLENVLIDQTADGACYTIRSRNASNWTVRNVGFVGTGQAGDGGNRFQFQVSTPSGANGLIENVWMSGKSTDTQPSTELGGVYVRNSHAGHIDIRHTYIEGFGNNAVYASAVGKDSGGEGSVVIENAYHRDNTVSQFRIGSPGSAVRNSIGVVNDPDGKRGTYPGGTSQNARGVWGKHFPDQRVENCAFHVDPDDANWDEVFGARYITDRSRGSEAVVEVVDCDYNSDAPRLTDTTSNASINFSNLGEQPTTSVLQDGGVPTSPEMAADGGREMPTVPEMPSGNPTASVSLTLVAESNSTEGNIRVDVSDDSGNAVSSVSVTAVGPESYSGTTDTNGVVLFENVPVGEYTVECAPTGYQNATATVKSGDFK